MPPPPGAPPAPSFSTGLFHLAVLVPDRLELARSLQRAAAAGWRLTGASDHLVSEALYLQDPEGNGIEIYRDRPRNQGNHDNGELRMFSDVARSALFAGTRFQGRTFAGTINYSAIPEPASRSARTTSRRSSRWP